MGRRKRKNKTGNEKKKENGKEAVVKKIDEKAKKAPLASYTKVFLEWELWEARGARMEPAEEEKT